MIEASALTKIYDGRKVVDSLDLSIEKGEVFGLLGPNASGKTTTIRMLCGIIPADNGEVRLNQLPINQAKTDFGYVAQHFGQYEELTVWENLKFYASMYGVNNKTRLNELLEHYSLQPFKHQLAGSLSGGYQRRLALVCALAHDPKILFLDEPTAGIDPVMRKQLWDDFYRLSAEGKTLFVTTHYMEEAQRCSQLGFLSNGKLVAQGTPDDIGASLGKVQVLTANLGYQAELHQALHQFAGVILVNQFGRELRVIAEPKVLVKDLQQLIAKITGSDGEVKMDVPNLEDVFIALTQKPLNSNSADSQSMQQREEP